MFPLHDRNRRHVCRAIFLLAGLLPAFGALVTVALLNTAAHRNAICRQWELATGLKVQAEDISHPRPGQLLARDVQLIDPISGQTAARMRLLEITSDSQGPLIACSQPELDVAQAPVLLSLVRRHLGPTSLGGPSIRLIASELTLRWPQGAQTLVDVSAQLDTTDTGRQLTASFFTAGNSSAEPAVFRATRDGSAQSDTALQLDTKSSALPCSLLAALAQCENRLGSHSTFSGQLTSTAASDGCQTEVSGRMENIDLDAAVTDQFPHRLGGPAELSIQKAVLIRGRLAEAQGEIRAGPGVVSESFVASAAAWLGLVRATEVNPARDLMEYSQLAVAFVLDAHGLALQGLCGPGGSGVVLRAAQGPLLSDSSAGPAPAVALAGALVPDSRVQIPATRQTDWLLHVLPVPEVAPRDSSALPQGRLRGVEVTR